jgi:hypothetical protein
VQGIARLARPEALYHNPTLRRPQECPEFATSAALEKRSEFPSLPLDLSGIAVWANVHAGFMKNPQ